MIKTKMKKKIARKKSKSKTLRKGRILHTKNRKRKTKTKIEKEVKETRLRQGYDGAKEESNADNIFDSSTGKTNTLFIPK